MGIDYGKLLEIVADEWYPGGPTITFPVGIGVDGGGKIPHLPTDIEVVAENVNDNEVTKKLST